MGKYVLAYKGGGMAATEAEQQAAMEAWGAWFGSLGSAIVDGGNPFATSKVVKSDGSVSDGDGSGLSGYSIVEADSLDAAAGMAKGCPILSGGGAVEVYETINIM